MGGTDLGIKKSGISQRPIPDLYSFLTYPELPAACKRQDASDPLYPADQDKWVFHIPEPHGRV